MSYVASHYFHLVASHYFQLCCLAVVYGPLSRGPILHFALRYCSRNIFVITQHKQAHTCAMHVDHSRKM